MSLRSALAAVVITVALLLSPAGGALGGGASADCTRAVRVERECGQARGDVPAKPQVKLARPSKDLHLAKVRFDAEEQTRITIGLRLAGKPIEGRRALIDTATLTEDVEPGKVRLELPLRGAARSCFGYVSCRLKGHVTASPLTPPVPPATEPTAGEPSGSDAASRGVPTGEPEIHEKHIPFGSRRRGQMADYSKRHYGKREWRLEPHGIVEHYTASATAGPALATFTANRPDVEYHELPGVCAHYLIDRDGTILELVPTEIRCRHTVGLNHETIGIEHVGQSDADVVGRPRVLRSSLALTSWLRCAYAIERSNVIGHNESLDSPLYKELDPVFQGRTHGDMRPGTMKGYRKRLTDC